MKLTWGPNLFGIPNKRIKLDNHYFERIRDTEMVWDKFNEVLDSESKHIEIDFSECTNISNTGLTILASLGPLCNKKGRKITIELGNNEEWIKKFSRNMLSTNTKNNKLKEIPFSLINDEKSVLDVLNDLNKIEDMNNLLPDTFNEISSRLFELCSNACEHGNNPIGAVCNGLCEKQFFTFTVFDFGEGIKNKVNSHLKKELSSKEALEWAFKYSNSTCQSMSCPRGAGFTTIFSFVQKYKGQLIIYTDNTYCIFKNNKYYYKNLNFGIPGTLITITISIV